MTGGADLPRRFFAYARLEWREAFGAVAPNGAYGGTTESWTHVREKVRPKKERCFAPQSFYHRNYTIMVRLTISGIVITANSVDRETRVTANSESRLNIDENTTVFAAVGALVAITIDVKSVPRRPQRYNIAKIASGKAISRRKIAKTSFLSFSTLNDVIFAM